MNIGIYLDDVDFSVPSHHRLQTAILDGLVRKNSDRHQLYVLTTSKIDESKKQSSLKFVTLKPNVGFQTRLGSVKSRLAPWLLRVGLFVGLPEGKWANALRRWQHFQPAYYAQLKDLEIDVVWHMMGAELPSPLPSIRTVLDINHRIHPEYWSIVFHQFIETYLSSIRTSSFIIVGTNEGKRQLATLFNVYEPRIRVIPFPTPFLPDTKDMAAPDLGFKEPYIFYPARFWRHKNHVVAIAALKVLRDKWNIRMNLVFSGKEGEQEMDGNNFRHVMNYAQTLGVQDQVKHVGEVPLIELSALYKHALALAFVSATGPDNLPPLEAMSVGCPAVVADVPGAREQYGDACLFFPSMDEHALAEHIKFLLDNPQAREELIARGFERAKKWTADDYASEVISLFDEFALIRRAWGPSSSVFY